LRASTRATRSDMSDLQHLHKNLLTVFLMRALRQHTLPTIPNPYVRQSLLSFTKSPTPPPSHPTSTLRRSLKTFPVVSHLNSPSLTTTTPVLTSSSTVCSTPWPTYKQLLTHPSLEGFRKAMLDEILQLFDVFHAFTPVTLAEAHAAKASLSPTLASFQLSGSGSPNF